MRSCTCCAPRIGFLSRTSSPLNVADVRLTEELIAEAALGEGVGRRLLEDPAYSSEDSREALAKVGILLATERAGRRRGVRQHIGIALDPDGRGEVQELWLAGGWATGAPRP